MEEEKHIEQLEKKPDEKHQGIDELEERTNLSHTVSQIIAIGENTAQELMKSREIKIVGNN